MHMGCWGLNCRGVESSWSRERLLNCHRDRSLGGRNCGEDLGQGLRGGTSLKISKVGEGYLIVRDRVELRLSFSHKWILNTFWESIVRMSSSLGVWVWVIVLGHCGSNEKWKQSKSQIHYIHLI
jgi:hypothetical protein